MEQPSFLTLPISSRYSFLYAEYGSLEVEGHAVVLQQGEHITHFPIGASCAILIMPGTQVSHAAVKVCAQEDCLLLWVGENGVRLYASGNPGRNSDAVLRQASLFLDPSKRLAVARRIFKLMFNEEAPQGRSIDQLRGIEGSRVKEIYPNIASQHGLIWKGRTQVGANDPLNYAISTANAALYGIVEAVVVTMGYIPSIGFIHTGDARSFIFDIADCLKFNSVVPLAMKIASESRDNIEMRTRHACRDLFARERVPERIVSIIATVMEHE